MLTYSQSLFFFFFNDTATTEIYTLSLHDALPICQRDEGGQGRALVAALFLLDLDDQFLAFADDFVDAGLAGGDAFGEILLGDFLEGQEAVAVLAVIDEAGLEAGLHARDHGLVDVALALLAPFDFDFVVEQLLAIDDGKATFFRLRGVDEHPFHDAFPLFVFSGARRSAASAALRRAPEKTNKGNA